MKSTQLPEIGARLREYRVKLHLTQAQMAEKLEMSLNYYGQIERGKKGLSIDKIILCRDKLGVDLNYLLTGILPLENEFIECFKKCPKGKRIYVVQAIKIICELCK